MTKVPEHFSKTVSQTWGQIGTEWLDQLPDLIAQIEDRWSVRLQEPFESSYSYAARATAPGAREVVVKLELPNDDFTREVEALRLYGGRGAVMLLKADPSYGSIMLESLRPGRMLSDLTNDERATSIAARVMRRLWCPVPEQHPFPTVSEFDGGLEWLRQCLANKATPVPIALVGRAEALLWELVLETAEPVLLHGDLHQYNILSAGRSPWLAVDPKGVVGDPAYDIGPFLYNRLFETDNPANVLERRVDQMSEELGFERDRIVGAAIPRAVLAAWPSGSSGEAWGSALMCAELLNKIRT